MTYRSKSVAMVALSLMNMGGAQADPMRTNTESLSTTATEVAEILKSGKLERIKKYLRPSNVYLSENGEIDALFSCFLSWKKNCIGKKQSPISIVINNHFIHYDDIDQNVVLVSYIRSKDKEKFLKNKDKFFDERYLSSYFSCNFTFDVLGWYIENGCYYESEPPYMEEFDSW